MGIFFDQTWARKKQRLLLKNRRASSTTCQLAMFVAEDTLDIYPTVIQQQCKLFKMYFHLERRNFSQLCQFTRGVLYTFLENEVQPYHPNLSIFKKDRSPFLPDGALTPNSKEKTPIYLHHMASLFFNTQVLQHQIALTPTCFPKSKSTQVHLLGTNISLVAIDIARPKAAAVPRKASPSILVDFEKRVGELDGWSR